MKCEDVQFQLWSGIRSNEVNEHLQTCSTCQSEKEAMTGIMERLSELDIPTPTRSLKPSDTVIRSTVQRNKRMRWMRSTTVAASLTVLLGTAATLGWNQLSADPADMTGPSNSMGNSGMQKTQPNVPDNRMAVQDSFVTVSDVATNREFCEVLQGHLAQLVNASEIKSIVIRDFKIDPYLNGQIGAERVTGTATLDVDLKQPDAVSALKPGTIDAAVEFRKGADGAYAVKFTELTVAPAEAPAEVVKAYASAMRNREGMQVYSLYAPQKRVLLRESYAETYWSVGVSSPWVESADVLSEDVQGDQAVIQARLNLATSAGPAGVQMATFALRKEQGKFWYLDDVQIADMAPAAPTMSLDLGAGQSLGVPETEMDFEGARVSLFSGNTVADGMEMVHLVGNHAGVMKQEDVQIPAGKATLMTVERDDPAAAGGAVSKEYWLAVLRDNPSSQDDKYGLAIVLKGNLTEQAAREKLLRLGANWKITE